MASLIKDVIRALTDRMPFAKAEGPTEWLAPDPSDAAAGSDAPFPGISAPVERTTPAEPDKKLAATRTVTKAPAHAEPTVVLAVDVTVDLREPAAAPAPAGTAPAEKAPARKAPAKRAPRKTAARKPAADPGAVEPKASAESGDEARPQEPATAQRPAARKAASGAAEAAQPKKAAPRKAAARKAAAASPVEAQSEEKPAPAAEKSAPASKPAKTSAAPAKPVAKESSHAAAPLPVVEGEEPWSEAEIAQVRAELSQERERLQSEIAATDAQLAEMLRDAGDGAVDDQADAGSRTFEREQELSLAASSAEMLEQVDHALRRLDDGAYGVCENCGKPIGKLRLQAFPRATLCLACKEQQERR